MATLWVFAYGSLMWEPSFPCAEVRPALLRGYHRALCILSIRNRGTEAGPGWSSVSTGAAPAPAGRSGWRPVTTRRRWPISNGGRWRRGRTGRSCSRSASTAAKASRPWPSSPIPRHRQYVGSLPAEEAAALVRQGRGSYGNALDYLRNVVAHLDAIGIADGPLHRVLALAEQENGA